jgi:hypothetical protein
MGELMVLMKPVEDDLGGDTPTLGSSLARGTCDDGKDVVLGEVGDILKVSGEVEGVVDADESLCNAEAVRPFFQWIFFSIAEICWSK